MTGGADPVARALAEVFDEILELVNPPEPSDAGVGDYFRELDEAVTSSPAPAARDRGGE